MSGRGDGRWEEAIFLEWLDQTLDRVVVVLYADFGRKYGEDAMGLWRRRRRAQRVLSHFDPVEWEQLTSSLPASAVELLNRRTEDDRGVELRVATEDDQVEVSEQVAGPDFFLKLGAILRDVSELVSEIEREREAQEESEPQSPQMDRLVAGLLDPDISLDDLHELRRTVAAFTADPNRLSSLRAIALSADRIGLVVREAIRVRMLVQQEDALDRPEGMTPLAG